MLKDRKMSFASDFSDTISFQQHSGERTSHFKHILFPEYTLPLGAFACFSYYTQFDTFQFKCQVRHCVWSWNR